MQINPLPVAVPGIIGLIFFHEQLRPGQTEAVDALLHVPHHENVVFPPADRGNAGQYRLLDQVAVLVLVDHHLRELLLIFPGRQGRNQLPFLFLRQDPQRKLLHIAEIDHIFALLLFRESLTEPDHQLRKHLHDTVGGFHVLQQFLRSLIEIGCRQVLHQLFHLIPERLDLVPFFRRHAFILFRRQTFPIDSQDPFIQSGKCIRSQDPLQHLPVCFQHIPVHIRPVRLLTDPDPLSQKLPDIRKILLHLRHGLAEIHRLLHTIAHGIRCILHVCRIRRVRQIMPFCAFRLLLPAGRIHLRALPEPLLRLGIASGILVELQDQFLQLPVISPASQLFHKLQKAFRPLLIAFLQQILQNVLLQKL